MSYLLKDTRMRNFILRERTENVKFKHGGKLRPVGEQPAEMRMLREAYQRPEVSQDRVFGFGFNVCRKCLKAWKVENTALDIELVEV